MDGEAAEEWIGGSIEEMLVVAEAAGEEAEAEEGAEGVEHSEAALKALARDTVCIE